MEFPSRSVYDSPCANFESCLETLERDKLTSEFILFGLELPAKNPRALATSIATLNVIVSPEGILSCFRISTKGDRSSPMVVKLLSRDIWR